MNPPISGSQAISLSTSADDVTSPLKAIIETFPARLLLVCVIVGPFWVLTLMALANRYLPVQDATDFKDLLTTCLKSLVVSGGGGAVVSSLFRTWGKINSQLSSQ